MAAVLLNILKGMGINQSLGTLILVNVAGSAMGYYICTRNNKSIDGVGKKKEISPGCMHQTN